MLESVGLQDVMHKKIRRLSGGMRQRVALAAAMVGSPELLVLDEPANGLDPDQRLQLRSLLSQSPTVLMSTHNISEVSALCHRVYVMFSGRVRFAGTPADLAGLAAGRVWEDDTPGPAGDPQLAHRDRHLPAPGRPARRRAGRRPDAGRRLPAARPTGASVTPPGWSRPRGPRRGSRWPAWPCAWPGCPLVADGAGSWPVGLLGIAAAALAAAVVAGLRDPAAALLAAVPTSAAVRRARRLGAAGPGRAAGLAGVPRQSATSCWQRAAGRSAAGRADRDRARRRRLGARSASP